MTAVALRGLAGARHSGNLSACAAVALGAALLAYGRGFTPFALGLATAALLLTLAAVSSSSSSGDGHRAVTAVLGLVAVIGSVTELVPRALQEGALPGPARVCTAVAGALVLTYFVRAPAVVTRARFGVILVAAIAAGWLDISAMPSPAIDTWWIQQLGARELLSGSNPYAALYPNFYPDERYYGPGVLADGLIRFYPYPPLTLIVNAFSVLCFGDVRFAFLLMVGIAGTLIRRSSPGPIGELAGAAIVMSPRSIFVLENAWTEPMVLAALAAVVYSIRRRTVAARWIGPGIALGVLATTKQYAPLLCIPLLFSIEPNARRRVVVLAVTTAALTVLPFLLWNPREFLFDTITTPLLQPFRLDALTWLVPFHGWGLRPTPAWGFAACVLVLSFAPRVRTLGRELAVSAAAFLAFLLFNKQAFTNYYWLAAGILICAAAADQAERATRSTS